MKKIFTLFAAATASMAMYASDVPVREIIAKSPQMHNVKEFNTLAHLATQAGARALRSPMMAESQAIDVPFTHKLVKNDANNSLWTFIDANADDRSWKIGFSTSYTSCMWPNADGVDSYNDWLFSPGINLKAGVEYTLATDLGYMGTASADPTIAVKIGSAATVEAMATDIMPSFSITKTVTTQKKDFTVAADGVYYIGYWANGPKVGNVAIKLSNVSVTVAEPEVPVETIDPPAAGTIEYTVAPKGELKAHVVYTAPTLTKSGAKLEKIDKVTIINRWYEKFEYTAQTLGHEILPGEKIELDVDLFGGGTNDRLEGIAYVLNSKGEYVAGESVLVTGIYAGPDNPLPVTNAKATVSDDGLKVTVSWDPVGETGENGGYVDTEKVTYYIFDAFGSYTDPAIATTDQTSHTFDYSALDGQDFFAYQITAGVDETYYSTETNTNIVVAGHPMTMPFTESFTDTFFQQVWAVDPNTSQNIMAGTVPDNYLQTNADAEGDPEPEYLNSQDHDNGFLYILPMNKDDVYGLLSLNTDISTATNPVLEFFYQGKGSAIDVLIATPDRDLTVEKTIDLKATPTTDWTQCQIDLKPFIAKKTVRFELRLRAIHNDDEHTWSVPIDNIRIRELVDKDLRAVALTAPEKAAAGEEFTLKARIENMGSTTSTAAQAKFYRNGDEIATKAIPAIAPHGVEIVGLNDIISLDDAEIVTYKVEILSYDDQDATNNTATANVITIMPAYPAPTGLQANVDKGEITLQWNAADVSEMTKPIETTEDFENPAYEAFSITKIGNWGLIDGDGGYTYYLERVNPYASYPMAFQLYDPEATQAFTADQLQYDVNPHSGKRFLLGPSTDGQNDNWLISPELPGTAQTVTFYAKSFSIAYPETFTCYYSTTDKELTSFKTVEATGDYYKEVYVPEQWTQYSISLPEGTKYFAIVQDSYDSYYLYLDDITYTAAPDLPADLAIVGYNVYRSGQKLNSDPLTSPTYTDICTHTEEGPHTHTYRVSTVYNYGESRHCDPVDVSVALSGINDIITDGDFSGNATYYTIDGKKVNASGMQPGIYIMRQGSKAAKVYIK